MDRTNVETVIVAGKIRKWKGRLLDHATGSPMDLRGLASATRGVARLSLQSVYQQPVWPTAVYARHSQKPFPRELKGCQKRCEEKRIGFAPHQAPVPRRAGTADYLDAPEAALFTNETSTGVRMWLTSRFPRLHSRARALRILHLQPILRRPGAVGRVASTRWISRPSLSAF